MRRSTSPISQCLLVEGADDKHVIWALCQRFQLEENFEVIDLSGIDEILKGLPVRFKASGINAIGVVVDADTDVNRRWESLRNLLIAQGFEVPVELADSGLILSRQDGLRVGVWIMPNNSMNGMLEDFLAFLVPMDDPLLPVASDTISNLASSGLTRFIPEHRTKALIHTWLAWQPDPGTPLGQAITKRYLTTDEKTCQQLVNWLMKLFSEAKV